MIYTFMPYSLDKNIGKAYNEYMKLIGPDDWAVFLDHDMMWLDTNWYRFICLYFPILPKVGLVTVVCNRIGNNAQVPRSANPMTHDIRIHREIAKRLKRQNGVEFKNVTHGNPISGVVMATSKKAWEMVGGFYESGILAVDNNYHQRIAQAGLNVYIANGLYVYHWYRGNNEGKTHLRK